MTDSPTAERRRSAAVAGHIGDGAAARRFVDDVDASVRSVAYQALERLQAIDHELLSTGLGDSAASVRRTVARLAGGHRDIDLVPFIGDDDASVVEMIAWALGEHERATAEIVTSLTEVATHHADALCRESAMAALGAIGDDRGLPAILAGCTDRPAVRRRAVLALAPFDGPEVDAALQRALEDRDWQVRQAAEDLSG